MKTAAILASLFTLIFFVDVAPAIDEPRALELLVQAVANAPSDTARIGLLRGMHAGLKGRRDVPAPDSWKQAANSLVSTKNKEVRELAIQLSAIFGDETASQHALSIVQSQEQPPAARRRALVALLTQQNAKVFAALPSLLDQPAMRIPAIRAYASKHLHEAPELLLKHYSRWNPDERRAVLETLAAREEYGKKLLAAIQMNRVPKSDVPIHVARSLELMLGDTFIDVFGKVRRLEASRSETLKKYKTLLTDNALANADLAKGRLLFNKTCASCHTLYGVGAKIGPDLTGSNRANLDYILLNSIDPSYDVPDSYKLLNVRTVDGRVVSGVIAEEDGKRLVLKTVEQPLLVLLKEDIAQRKVSEKSMMPDGQLDRLKAQEVIDLIAYLRTTEQVETKP